MGMAGFGAKRIFAVSLSFALLGSVAFAGGVYDEGASDTEVKIGNTTAYSGPFSVNGISGRTLAAYFQMLNEKGGINGRKINFISYDDAYSPPKTVEQVRKLVESDRVLATLGIIGTGPNLSIARYMNDSEVPQLFAGSGNSKLADPKTYPWTVGGLLPNYQVEAEVYGKAIITNDPNAKVGIIYQNDDFGKDYYNGLKKGLGDKASAIVAAEPFEMTEPTIDSHIVNLRASGANVVLIATTSKFAIQSYRKIAELGWKPLIYTNTSATAIETILKPAGLENVTGLISSHYMKDPSDPAWSNDEGMKEFNAFIDKYAPNEPRNNYTTMAFLAGKLGEYVIKTAGDNLTRENIRAVAASMKDVPIGVLLPGILVNTAPDDYSLIKQFQLVRFNGKTWERFGEIQSAD